MPFGDYILSVFILAIEPPPTVGFSINQSDVLEPANQPDAIVPDHPRVQEFLRGPREKLVYKNFSGLPAARAWTNKHRASECYTKVILGSGIGKNAYVEIIKTMQLYQYEKLLSVYIQEIVEYKRLVNVVPGYTIATLLYRELLIQLIVCVIFPNVMMLSC